MEDIGVMLASLFRPRSGRKQSEESGVSPGPRGKYRRVQYHDEEQSEDEHEDEHDVYDDGEEYDEHEDEGEFGFVEDTVR